MTLDEAIGILEANASYHLKCGDPLALQATQLGIEALKRCKKHKYSPYQMEYHPLPGETEE